MSDQQTIPAIAMRGVGVSAMRDASVIVLEDVNWTVARGEFWVVGGPQHSGKSDLTLLAAGLMPPADGRCEIFGRDPQTFGEAQLAERLRVGFVPEEGRLFSHLTLAENVALPLRYHKNLAPDAAAAEVKALLDLMELTPFADLTPANVAANWRRRAALARALILKPELLLLDNPLGGLASRHFFWWLRFLDQLWRGHEFLGGQPMTISATTDDFRPWRNLPHRFAVLRDGQFIPLGSWRDVEISDDPAVKELLALELEPLA
jgi:ABC-type transporter Mla maintaining outer membrane lipid asymmetry ATPase subunit MlaF